MTTRRSLCATTFCLFLFFAGASASCAGNCFTGRQPSGCWCDNSCRTWQDCCDDFHLCEVGADSTGSDGNDGGFVAETEGGGFEFEEPDAPPDCTQNFMWARGSKHCFGNDGIRVLSVRGTNPTDSDLDIFWDIQEGSGDVRFRIRNPFDTETTVYVRYLDPIGFGPENHLVCTDFTLTNCDDFSSPSIQASCSAGMETQVTMIEVYFVDVTQTRPDIFGEVEIDSCCHANDPPPNTVAAYSLMIRCNCPFDPSNPFFFGGAARRQLRNNVGAGAQAVAMKKRLELFEE